MGTRDEHQGAAPPAINPPAKDAHKSPPPSPELVLQEECGCRVEGATPWEAGVPWGLLAVVTLGFARQRPLNGQHDMCWVESILLLLSRVVQGCCFPMEGSLQALLFTPSSVYTNSFSPCCFLPGPCVLCREGEVFQAVSTLLIVSVSIHPLLRLLLGRCRSLADLCEESGHATVSSSLNYCTVLMTFPRAAVWAAFLN